MKKISYLLFPLFLFSCEKEDVNEEKTITIELSNPKDGEEIPNQSKLKINGTIEGNFELHGYSITLVNLSNNDSTLLEVNKHTHGEIIPFEEEWLNNLKENSNLLLEVVGHGDHSGDLTASKMINVIAIGL